MTTTIRAKLQLTEKTDVHWGTLKRLKFQTVYDDNTPEDKKFQKATPSGFAELYVDNPVAVDFFKLGKYYYFDAIEVE